MRSILIDKNRLYDAYEASSHGLYSDAEPFKSVELIENYRHYWRPEKVRVILLAESHVYTSDVDRTQTIKPLLGLDNYPTEYAKFVYCLGYGEKELTSGECHPKRDGTPQFWKLFFSCLHKIHSNSDFAPILKSTTSFKQRIQSKLDLLSSLQSEGIWLVDASIVALYHQGKKPEPERIHRAVKSSWDRYTSKVLEEANPDHIVVIGKGVAQTLQQDLQKCFKNKVTVLPQPNARLSSEQQRNNFQTCFRICSSVKAV